MKKEEFIFTFFKNWDDDLSLHVPFDPIICSMAEAPRKELECNTAV